MKLSRTLLSLCVAGLLAGAPLTAFANDNDDQPVAAHHHKHHGNADRDHMASRVDRLVDALNNQVALLNAQAVKDADEDEDEGEVEASVPSVVTVSLAKLETKLDGADATRVGNAVSANTAGLQAFLSGGSPAANEILSALSAANIAPSSVLAILPKGDDRLIVFIA